MQDSSNPTNENSSNSPPKNLSSSPNENNHLSTEKIASDERIRIAEIESQERLRNREFDLEAEKLRLEAERLELEKQKQSDKTQGEKTTAIETIKQNNTTRKVIESEDRRKDSNFWINKTLGIGFYIVAGTLLIFNPLKEVSDTFHFLIGAGTSCLLVNPKKADKALKLLTRQKPNKNE